MVAPPRFAAARLPGSGRVPEVHLHIGLNKTGTSAIQRFLASHPVELRRHGVLYPQTGRRGDAHYGLSRALGFAHGRERTIEADERNRLGAELRDEFAQSGCSRIILSSEDFVIPGEVRGVREFLDGFDCRIVAYVRRHDHWWLSAWNQAVRMVVDPPWPAGDIQSYLRFQRKRRSRYGDFRRLLESWADAFDPAHVVVRPFESTQNPRGVVADFVETVGLQDLAVLAGQQRERINESSGIEALYLLDIVQRAGLAPTLRERLKAGILADPQQGERDIARIMPPGLRRRLIRENRPDYAWIARTFLGRADGTLFIEPDPGADPDWQAPVLPGPAEALGRILRIADTG